MKNRVQIMSVLMLLLGIVLIYSGVNIHDLNEENSRLYEQISRYEQSALDWQTKAEATEIKLAKAETDLQLCSAKIEELETELILTKDENEALQRENEYLLETSEYVYNGYWNYNYDHEDVEVLAGVMYGENWISGRYEMMLTGSVVLNRVLDKRFPNNIHDVVYQIDGGYEQYAPRTKRLIGSSEVPEICYDLARILLDYGPIAPRNVVYQAHFNQGEVFWDWNGEEFCFG